MPLFDKIVTETKIKPKYIILCKGAEKKTVYQDFPKEIKVGKTIHKTYIQNTINNKDNVDYYTHAIIVDENNIEHVIENGFLFQNMFNNLKNSLNKEYCITNIMGIPIIIQEIYEKQSEEQTEIFYDKKKLLLFGGVIFLLAMAAVCKIIL
jgi:hypothetical protein